MVLGEVEETITIVDVNEDTFEEVIRVCRNFFFNIKKKKNLCVYILDC